MDHNATTPVDSRVLEAMLPYFSERPGNAASRTHLYGWMANEAVERAREQVAALLGVEAREITFTSGATEAANLALKGFHELYQRKGRHIITVSSEHNAVLDPCRRLERQGAELSYLPVDASGLVDPQALEAAIRPDTILVSIMWANNETGVIQPMEAIGALCAEKGVALMSDATQAVGKIPVGPRAAGVHLLTLSAHKFYGPKGVGALYVSRRQPRLKIAAQIDGGGHEHGIRSGTLNVPGIVGLGQAAEIAMREMEQDAQRLRGSRDRLEQVLLSELEECYINGGRAPRLPHTSNLSFRHVNAEALMSTFNRELAVSAGSACTSASLEPSHVLRAMGLSDDLAHGALRLSLGRGNTDEEVDRAARLVIEGVRQLRARSPIWDMFKKQLIS
jgi:cysteine desulfurase